MNISIGKEFYPDGISHNLTRHFVPFWLWECWRHGLYRASYTDNENYFIDNSYSILSKCSIFELSCRSVTMLWKNSCLHHLTNATKNRKAWMGQAACCFFNKSPNICTRKAWRLLTLQEKRIANNIAQEVIESWINTNLRYQVKANRQLKLFDYGPSQEDIKHKCFQRNQG